MRTGRAAVLTGERTIEQREVDLPDVVGEQRALLKVEACGLCGTDWAQYQGEVDVDYPFIPGHEVIGRIEQIGAEAAERWGVNENTRVAVGSPETCGICEYCIQGRTNLCLNRFEYGFTGMDVGEGLWGGYAEYMVLRPNTSVFELPEDLDRDLGVMFNPVGNGIEWVHKANVRIGDSVLVLGPGQRGLACVLACNEEGAGTIIVTGLDEDDHKLELAREFGATHTINVERENTVDRVMEITDSRGVDIVIDTTPNAIQPVLDGIEAAKRAGTIILSGHKDMREAPITVDDIVHKELEIEGVFIEGPWADEQAIRLIAFEKYPLEEIHTHTFSLDEVETALQTLGGETDERAIHITVVP